MRVEQRIWQPGQEWRVLHEERNLKPSLVLYFAAPGTLDDGQRFAELRKAYPGAKLLGCSTGGEIVGDSVHDGSVVATAIEFAATALGAAKERTGGGKGSFDIGVSLAQQLERKDLRGVFVLSDGTTINGTELVAGVQKVLGRDIGLTGGLAGDGADFRTTRVGLDANPEPGMVVAMGFYGTRIAIGSGSVGGWDTVGPQRVITRAEGNTLFDLDGMPALDLYKQYLGAEAARLPASALLFPLRVHPPGDPDAALVRTVVGIDEERKAMIYAGTIPQGYTAQVMLGHFDNLIAGAGDAAKKAAIPAAKLAILVSCIGRKLLLGQRTADEVEAVAEVLGATCRTAGFYSYGEIAPMEASSVSDLHNQTMTITTIAEAA
ncbi:MAG TPA: FIST N-terminal domain-containing protein [Stellaceae bacterium]|nr:FIST N-terminal domain-containing protein [Stellaceae bacterium]